MPLSFDELDFGPPHYRDMLPPVCRRNYGKWKYHEHVRGGIIRHVSESGEEAYTVRAGIPKYLSADTVIELCELAERYCEGYLKFTSRHNIEFIAGDRESAERLAGELERLGFPVGGTGRCLKAIIHCVAMSHCHMAAADSLSIAKALYEEFYEDFRNPEAFPERVKIAVSGCLNMCGATHASDIAVIGVHRRPPVVEDAVVEKVCSVPELVKSCPTYAIKPKRGNPRSVEIDEEKCVYCGICYSLCEGIRIHDPENDGVSLWVGGKASNTRAGPLFARLVVPYMKPEQPRWSTLVGTVRRILEVYRENARRGERMGEWIERIGWERFFRLAEIEFSEKCIDDWIFSVETFRRGTNFKMP